MDWLAAGLDPNRATIFVQSQVLEHAELHLLLSMITPLRLAGARSDLQRADERDQRAVICTLTVSWVIRCFRRPTS